MGFTSNFGWRWSIIAIVISILANVVLSTPATGSSSETILEMDTVDNNDDDTRVITGFENFLAKFLNKCKMDDKDTSRTETTEAPQDEGTSSSTLEISPILIGIVVAIVLVMVFLSLAMCWKRAQVCRSRHRRPVVCIDNRTEENDENCQDCEQDYPTIIQKINDPEAFRKWCHKMIPNDAAFIASLSLDTAAYATISPLTSGKSACQLHGDGLNDIREFCAPVLTDNPKTSPQLMVITVIHKDHSETRSIIPWSFDIASMPQ